MDTPFMGMIIAAGFNFAPRGWALCWGQQMAISQNTALFSLLGTTFGGNGQTTFALPDLRGRVAVGWGNGLGLSPYVIGQVGGTENTTLTLNNMPIHNHTAVFTPTGSGTPLSVTVNVSSQTATQSVPGTSGANTLGAPTQGRTAVSGYVNDPSPAVPLTGVTSSGGGITGGTVAVGVAGGSTPFGILQPYLAITYAIALSGIFPSRN